MVRPLLLLSLLSLPQVSLAGEGSKVGVGGVANQALNSQSAVGSVNQAPIGGINSNYQINNSQATDFGFGPGIYCRGANFGIGAYASGASSNAYNFSSSGSDFGALALITLPLNGEVVEQCKALAREIVRQRQLDTAYNLIKVCSSFKKDGIVLDPKVFPEFEICKGVSLSVNK